MSVSLILDLKLLLGAKHIVKSLLLISVSISVRTREKNLFWENVTVSAIDILDVEPLTSQGARFQVLSASQSQSIVLEPHVYCSAPTTDLWEPEALTQLTWWSQSKVSGLHKARPPGGMWTQKTRMTWRGASSMWVAFTKQGLPQECGHRKREGCWTFLETHPLIKRKPRVDWKVHLKYQSCIQSFGQWILNISPMSNFGLQFQNQ